MKHAPEKIVQYALTVISVMDQLLRKLITIHALLKHSHDQEEVSGSCKAFQQMKTQKYAISQSITQKLTGQIKRGLCLV